ncbi:methyltransferase [Bordetella genomosp. 10]|uniref:Putative 4-hydroxy-4-methyl-2-oxoglutarate aldolase n=1 Tax=Bordetella genomosp. 10 TaxID=1416804 RepID=A0A261SLI3_9BORD|nr:RraA family protein [Bordetella genomosp. 10]OZI37877.1 methyltransferase [Bordetella genomosp. 10]
MSLGLRIGKRERCVSAATIKQYQGAAAAHASDAMGRLFHGGSALRPMHKEGGMVGAALTVKTRPGDNLLVHKALGMLSPGDVLVVDAGGDTTNAIIGELMAGQAQQAGAAGVIIYGAIRDYGTINKGTFPIYAVGVTHRGPYKDGPGEINFPIAIDGMVINPGDLIVGDEDGVVAVPYDNVDEILKSILATREKEGKKMATIRAGEPMDRKWADDILRKLGCEGL